MINNNFLRVFIWFQTTVWNKLKVDLIYLSKYTPEDTETSYKVWDENIENWVRCALGNMTVCWVGGLCPPLRGFVLRIIIWTHPCQISKYATVFWIYYFYRNGSHWLSFARYHLECLKRNPKTVRRVLIFTGKFFKSRKPSEISA